VGGMLDKKEVVDYTLFLYSFPKTMLAKDKVKFIREFFGYNITKFGKDYSYGGLLQKLKGTKLSSSSFIVPHENASVVSAYLESRGVTFVTKK
jgi:hypothetical protein